MVAGNLAGTIHYWSKKVKNSGIGKCFYQHLIRDAVNISMGYTNNGF
jgi:hypothetical protein